MSHSPMKVCFLINGLGPAGAETLLLDIVTHTDADADIDYTVCFLEGEDTLVPEFENTGARVVDFEAKFKFDPRAMWRLARFFQREEFDILHTHLPYSQTLGRIFGRLGGQTTVVSTQHDFRNKYHPVTRTLERVTRPLDTMTVAVSRSVERDFTGESHLYPDHGDGWCTIHNGIGVDNFSEYLEQSNNTLVYDEWEIGQGPIFMTAGRYVSPKRQDVLIRAMKRVTEKIPDATLLVIGWGPLEDELRELVRRCGLEGSVHITGRVPSVEPYYAAADVFVFPSERESFGIVLLEAMAAKLPIVATNIPGPREVVDNNETGLLVPAGSPEDLAEAMIEFRSESKRSAFGRQGYDHVLNNFDIGQTVSSYLQLYEKLLQSYENSEKNQYTN
ncbi:glycosyltransferase [Halococcus qingdaonensis]|uniref:glycosyltransferase n=1 Tax=Halococcus qingdaonensis TaxID=224402 RepID=UPI002116696F|nr:glycosyltransferase [Halococcus qingdaonensis]